MRVPRGKELESDPLEGSNQGQGKNRQGFMIGYAHFFFPTKDCEDQEYYNLAFSADYASGRNSIGGGGFALTYYFTPNISLQTGPVWFNSAKFNGKWKWSIQIDINFPVFIPKPWCSGLFTSK